ncbi:MAG TPA: VOC family protein [Candidatus Acidoferrum sp.]|jgi:uncharacterized glyoxalase superfamily protein PhnB
MTESSAAPASAKARFQGVNPHFVVADVVAAAEYYREVFGFKILGYFWDPPVFAMVGRDDVVIQFGRIDRGQTVAPNRTRRDEALDAYIWVDDVDALYAELRGKGAKIVEEPKQQVWDCYEFTVEDAFGFRLIFSKSAAAK